MKIAHKSAHDGVVCAILHTLSMEVCMGIKQIGEGRFRLQIRKFNLRHDKVYATQEEAERVHAALLGYRTGRSSISFAEARRQYLESITYLTKKPHTQNTEKYRLVRVGKYFDKFDCAAIHKDDVYDYVSRRLREAKPPKPDSLRNEVRALSALLNFAVEKRWIQDNPARSVRLPAAPQRLRRIDSDVSGEILNLLASSEPRMRFLARHLALVINTGARPGEWAAVERSDIYFGDDPHVIFKDTKNSEDRIHPMSTDVQQLVRNQFDDVQKYLGEEAAKQNALLFPSKTGQTPYAFSGALRDAKKKGYLPIKLRIHDGRHEFVSVATESGELSDSAIMALVGHKSPASMKRYQQVKTKKFAPMVESLSRSFRDIRVQELAKRMDTTVDFIRACFKLYKIEQGLLGSNQGDLLYSLTFRRYLERMLHQATTRDPSVDPRSVWQINPDLPPGTEFKPYDEL
jgi:integrase